MKKREPNPALAPRHGTVRDRVKSLADQGLSRADIRARMNDDGANPDTVDIYLTSYCPGESDWTARAAHACDLHLADLVRERDLANAGAA